MQISIIPVLGNVQLQIKDNRYLGLKYASILIGGSEEKYEMDLPELLPTNKQLSGRHFGKRGQKRLQVDRYSAEFFWWLA